MNRASIGILVALLVAGCAHGAPGDRFISYNVKNEVKPVGDVDGHFAGTFRNHGVCLKNVGRPDEEVGIMSGSGTFDAVFTSATTTAKCVMSGRNTCRFADRSSHTDEWTATCKHGPDGKLVSEGRSTFVEGTGRFEGIQGGGTFTGRELIGDLEGLWISRPLTADATVPKR
jgi:hypothetical protein